MTKQKPQKCFKDFPFYKNWNRKCLRNAKKQDRFKFECDSVFWFFFILSELAGLWDQKNKNKKKKWKIRFIGKMIVT